MSNPSPNVGDVIEYVLTLINNGPDAATSVQVSDPLPAGLSLVSATPDQGTYDPATGQWDVGTVGGGSSVTLSILVTVTSPAPATNTATVSGSAQFDPVTTNNTASVLETPQQADLSLTKTVDDPVAERRRPGDVHGDGE